MGEVVREATDRAQRLVDALLALARLQGREGQCAGAVRAGHSERADPERGGGRPGRGGRPATSRSPPRASRSAPPAILVCWNG